MLNLRTALDARQIGERIQRVVLAAAERTTCQPLDRSRDGKSVPCVAEQGSQVAVYPMKRRLVITMSPDKAGTWSERLGARLEPKSARTTYLHLTDEQLADEAVCADAVEAVVLALQLCRGRPVPSHGPAGEAAPTDFGSCPEHGYVLDALGLCPTCDED